MSDACADAPGRTTVTSQDFEEFYRSSQHRVVTFLFAMTGDLGDAQDLAQESYERAWRHWANIAAYQDPEAWVRGVGYRLAANRWRKSRNRLRAYLRHGPPPPVEPPSDDAAALVAALRSLSPDQRLAVALHHLLDLPVTEIAHQLGVPENTVKTRLARGRRRLAELLDQFSTEENAHA
jgi:RNA polymerase sigma-70 factor (ECF subfamily)